MEENNIKISLALYTRLEFNCKILWVKIEITGNWPFFVGAYYRRVKEDLESLRDFQDCQPGPGAQ